MKTIAVSTIILCGLPGSGKSTIGKELARQLNVEFIDSDTLIESRCGMSCRQFFISNGDQAFRDLEEQVILELHKRKDCVIALGGGSLDNATIRKAVSDMGVVVHLFEKIEVLIERKVTQDKSAIFNGKASFKEKANKRLPFIQAAASIEVDVNGKSPENISIQIINEVRKQYGQ